MSLILPLAFCCAVALPLQEQDLGPERIIAHFRRFACEETKSSIGQLQIESVCQFLMQKPKYALISRAALEIFKNKNEWQPGFDADAKFESFIVELTVFPHENDKADAATAIETFLGYYFDVQAHVVWLSPEIDIINKKKPNSFEVRLVAITNEEIPRAFVSKKRHK